jgi:uncharacterized protein (DUF1330 family)
VCSQSKRCQKGSEMARKGYWVSAYRAIKDADAIANYANLAGAALQKFGAKYVTRDVAAAVYEAGIKARTVIVEFESVEKAIAARESPDYQAALKVLGQAVERDFRIVEGVD